MIYARQAFTENGWAYNLRISIKNGAIDEILPDSTPEPEDEIVDTLLPALSNLHSHSFQRAMAGMTEIRAKGKESFWTWRALMYRFLDRLTPEQIEAFAAFVQMEMLEAGYAAIGEFHYIHHAIGGRPYDNPAELSERIMAASAISGIGLTHLPVLYTYGGTAQEPLEGGQLRFSNTPEAFLALVEKCRRPLRALPADCALGIAPHSLRATTPDDLRSVLAAHPAGPVHIHVAEQMREVEDVRRSLGARPVEWLLGEAGLDARWCLIHATHLTEDETVALARSGAVAGLCPVTESNLGDGIFNGRRYVEAQGRFGLGSDSNIRISLTEELRTLEYSQRLRDQARNVMLAGYGSTGEALYLGAAAGGAQALGRNSGRIAKGCWADLVAIDAQDEALCALRPEQLLDGLCFAASDRVITDTWSAGRHMVRARQHIHRAQISARYRKAIAELVDGL